MTAAPASRSRGPSAASPDAEAPPQLSTAKPAAGRAAPVGKGAAPAARPARAPAGQPDGLTSVVLRNEFYRDGYRTLLSVAVIEGVVILGLIGALMLFFVTMEKEYQYFAVDRDGKLIEMRPTHEPVLSDDTILRWATNAAIKTFTFGFHDYRMRLQESSGYFTTTGWQGFDRALVESDIIKRIVDLNQVVTAVPEGAPVITQKGAINQRYEWIVELPLLVTYQSQGQTQQIRRRVTLRIVRVPTIQNPEGIGIEQWIEQ